MNDKERERQIQAMKEEVRKETHKAVENAQELARRIISNGTGTLIYRAISGRR